MLLKNDRGFKKTKGDFNIVDKKDGLIRWTNNRVFDIIYNDIKRGKNMAFRINNRRYTGSKYKILEWINEIIDRECPNCDSFCDLFAGTGVVTDSVFSKYKEFYINDFLYSNQIIYKAFYKKENYDFHKIMNFYKKYKNLDANSIDDNYVSINYGGKFFEYNDAKKIGFIREDIENNKANLNEREYAIIITSLLYSLDRCANTVGHYDAYFKKSNLRSNFEFELISPVVKDEDDERTIHITREDSNELAKKIDVDIVYIDPPYSSRQYSRFYHVLENIVKWEKPKLYGVALKPEPENMSSYCSSKAIDSFNELIMDLNCKYIVVSYNNTYNSKSKSSKNKMELEDILGVLKQKGETKQFSIKHQAFNAGKTELNNHQEFLFVTKVEVHAND